MKTEQRIWLNQYNDLHESLREWSFDIDGDTFLSPDAPTETVRLYSKMQQLGYSKRWL